MSYELKNPIQGDDLRLCRLYHIIVSAYVTSIWSKPDLLQGHLMELFGERLREQGIAFSGFQVDEVEYLQNNMPIHATVYPLDVHGQPVLRDFIND